MAYAELIAAIYIGCLGAFVTAHGALNKFLFRAPMFPISAALMSDALSRLGYL